MASGRDKLQCKESLYDPRAASFSVLVSAARWYYCSLDGLTNPDFSFSWSIHHLGPNTVKQTRIQRLGTRFCRALILFILQSRRIKKSRFLLSLILLQSRRINKSRFLLSLVHTPPRSKYGQLDRNIIHTRRTDTSSTSSRSSTS